MPVMPAKRSKLSPAQRAKREAKRARRAAAPRPSSAPIESLPETLERLGAAPSCDLEEAAERRAGKSGPATGGCCSNC